MLPLRKWGPEFQSSREWLLTALVSNPGFTHNAARNSATVWTMMEQVISGRFMNGPK